MELEFLVEMLEEGGYTGLFLWILFGASTLPVPNELIMMTIGLAASQTPSKTIPIFVTTNAGVITSLSASYLLGRVIGNPLLQLLARKKRFAKRLETSQKMMDKYHALSLSFSYFLPGARSVIPFLYGFSRLSFRKFALFAYTGATFWLFVMFTAGYVFGENIDVAEAYAGEISIVAIGLAALVILAVRHRSKKRGCPEEVVDEPIVAQPIPAVHDGGPE